MRMSTTYIPRLEGIGAVDPKEITGRVMIAGEPYFYRRGVLNFQGKVYAVSDDHDFVINTQNVPIGAIVGGVLVAIPNLSPQQLAYFKAKYKF